MELSNIDESLRNLIRNKKFSNLSENKFQKVSEYTEYIY